MTIVIIPTYNEKENIKSLVEEIFCLSPDINILIVDDNSPDGTGGIVKDLQMIFPKLALLERLNDRGLGKSYMDGFKELINNKQYEIVAMMDADFSHDHKEVSKMVVQLADYDMIIGSRYVQGGKIKNWNWRRRLLSRFANFYARTILGLPVKDLTAGYMVFRKSILNSMNIDSISSEGYAFLIDLKYKIFKAGYKIYEHPILFNERREGQSKMSFKNIWEAIWLPWKLKFKK